MTSPSKTKSRFEQLLSEIYARWVSENNQQVCIDCLKPRSNKNKFQCKNCSCAFMCSSIKIFHLKYSPICNAKNGSIVKN